MLEEDWQGRDPNAMFSGERTEVPVGSYASVIRHSELTSRGQAGTDPGFVLHRRSPSVICDHCGFCLHQSYAIASSRLGVKPARILVLFFIVVLLQSSVTIVVLSSQSYAIASSYLGVRPARILVLFFIVVLLQSSSTSCFCVVDRTQQQAVRQISEWLHLRKKYLA